MIFRFLILCLLLFSLCRSVVCLFVGFYLSELLLCRRLWVVGRLGWLSGSWEAHTCINEDTNSSLVSQRHPCAQTEQVERAVECVALSYEPCVVQCGTSWDECLDFRRLGRSLAPPCGQYLRTDTRICFGCTLASAWVTILIEGAMLQLMIYCILYLNACGL